MQHLVLLEADLETFQTTNEWGFVDENGRQTTVTQLIQNALLSTNSKKHEALCQFLLTMVTNDNEFYQLGKAPGPAGDRIICTIAVEPDVVNDVIQARTEAYNDLLASSLPPKKRLPPKNRLEQCLTMISKKPLSFIKTTPSSKCLKVTQCDIEKATGALCDLSSSERLCSSPASRIQSSPLSDTSSIANLASPGGTSLNQARSCLLSHLS
jgi:hypothetical protein